MKTIVLVTTSYPSVNDGSEAAGSFVQDFAEELANKARVIVLAPGQNKSEASSQPYLQVRRYAASTKPLSLLKLSKPWHWTAILKVLHSGAKALEQIIQENQVDHVFALWVLPSGWWALIVNKKYGVAYSTWALGSDIWSLGKIPLIRSLLIKVLQGSRHNFADGYQLAADVKAISARECLFLPSTRNIALPAETADSEDTGYKLAFLGRWHPNKGIDLLLEGLKLLDEEAWQKIDELRIYGGGPLQDTVREGVKKLTSEGRKISMGGYLDKAAAARLLQWSDYVLIPSRIESVPVIFSDAMKMGKPVLCTPVGDMGQLISQYECGLLAENVSARAFAELLSLALQKDKKTFGKGIARAAEDFSLPSIVETFCQSI